MAVKKYKWYKIVFERNYHGRTGKQKVLLTEGKMDAISAWQKAHPWDYIQGAYLIG